MVRKTRHIVFFVASMLLVLMQVACLSDSSRAKNVLVLLSYDRKQVQYKEFLRDIRSTLADEGYDVDLRPVCLSLDYSPERAVDILASAVEQLNKEGWEPDVIITEDERPAEILLNGDYGKLLGTSHVPMIFAGVRFLGSIDVNGRNNICVWYAPIDYYQNIKLAAFLSGSNNVQIELDDFMQDSLIREELAKAVNRPPFVDNINGLKLGLLNDTLLQTIYRDSVVVTTFSIASGAYDIGNLSDSIAKNPEAIRTFFKISTRYPSLIVKKDLYGNAIANKSGRPQFTAVNANFADGKGNVLAGYFAGYPTIARDCGLTAAKIFHGAHPSSLSGRRHNKMFWMDYGAMKRMGLRYDDYKKTFHIINVPLKLENPILYRSFIVIGCIVLLLVLLGVGIVLHRFRKRLLNESLRHIERSRNISRLCLNSVENMPIESADDVERYLRFIHPDHQEEKEVIRQQLLEKGTYSTRVFCAPKGDENYQWWEFRFLHSSTGVIGLIINKAETVEFEERSTMVDRSSDEVDREGALIDNLSADIKKPLDMICDSCDLLTDKSLNGAGRQEIIDRLQANSKALNLKIDDILLFSRIESGRIRYQFVERNARDFIRDYHEKTRNQVPAHLDFILLSGRSDILFNADVDALRSVLNQFIRNAVKFTQKGAVVLGWRYHLGKNLCEFFVEDTGTGLSPEQSQRMFDLFWKNKGTVEGVGLGLNICRSLAHAMNGRISGESIQGVGNRFSIWLPARSNLSKP